jgi:uncharacterized protein YhdP
MKRLLTRSAFLVWLALSAFIVLTALIVSVIRVLLPLVSDYRELSREEVSVVVAAEAVYIF